MKYVALFVALLSAACLFSACKKDSLEHAADYGMSYQQFQSFKKTTNNSYEYKVIKSSWAMYSWSTVITVSQGKVVKRSYKVMLHQGQPALPPDQMEWVENENEINSHTNGTAAEAVTLDVVYQHAKNEWLIKRKDTDFYFETKNNGMISTCGYVPRGCMDDCFTGIYIEYIHAL